MNLSLPSVMLPCGHEAHDGSKGPAAGPAVSGRARFSAAGPICPSCTHSLSTTSNGACHRHALPPQPPQNTHTRRHTRMEQLQQARCTHHAHTPNHRPQATRYLIRLLCTHPRQIMQTPVILLHHTFWAQSHSTRFLTLSLLCGYSVLLHVALTVGLHSRTTVSMPLVASTGRWG